MADEIIFTDDYLIGIEEIDVQHKQMCKIINKCIKTANGYLPELKLDDLLTELLKYAKWHFQCEESLMNIYNYPHLDEHTNEHNILLKSMEEKQKIVKSEDCDLHQLSNFFFGWFGGHSFGYDKKMGHYCMEKWDHTKE